MTITARVIADSCQAGGRYRLTTFELRYPRFIHAELMTHRVFSRNASSSRAIPIQRLIQEVVDDPAMPVWWGKNQAGMQAREELSDVHPTWDGYPCMSPRDLAKHEWLRARDSAVRHVQELMKLELHKQLANRLLEPWSHISVVVTSTDWANWYALRNHADAQPEMKALAEAMLAAHRASVPRVRGPGQWHLPYFRPEDETWEWTDPMAAPRVSSARCARVSYLRHDGTPVPQDEDLTLYERLMGGHPKHASPTEHQARVPVPGLDYDEPSPLFPAMREIHPWLCSNLNGWVQHRKLVSGENTTSYEEFDR